MSIYKNRNSDVNILEPLTYMGLGVSFVTLFISTRSTDPFNTPKLVALLILSSYSLNYLLKHWHPSKVTSNKVDLTFFLFLSFFLTSGLISVIFSDNLFIALVGDSQRRNGFLAYFTMTIMALAVSRAINYTNYKNLFKISVLTGLVFSIYGVIQMIGRDPVNWNNPYNSVIATLGNPNFASALMAIFSILSFSVQFFKNFSLRFKFLSLACIVFSFIAIVASNSRQGLVSLSFALAFYLSVHFYFKQKKLGAIVIFLSVISSILAIAGMLQKGPLTSLLYKPSISVRGFYWDAAIEMLKNYPLTGVGFDHYGYYFKELRSSEYPLRVGFDLTSTNAHNTFLQMFATGGILLGISYSLIVISTLIVGIRLIKKSESSTRGISIGLLSAWISFQAQSVISVDNIGISVWGWILTGAIFGLASRNEFKEKITAQSRHSKSVKNQITVMPFLITLVFLIPAITLSIALMRVEREVYITRVVADDYFSQVNRNGASSQRLLDLFNQRANYVLENKMSDPNYKVQIAYDMFNMGQQTESIRIAKEIVKSNPRNLYALEAVATFSRVLGDFKAEVLARKSIEKLDPWNAKNYLQLMILYKVAGDITNAQLMLDEILSFAPDTNEAKAAIEEFSK